MSEHLGVPNLPRAFRTTSRMQDNWLLYQACLYQTYRTCPLHKHHPSLDWFAAIQEHLQKSSETLGICLYFAPLLQRACLLLLLTLSIPRLDPPKGGDVALVCQLQ